MHLNCIPPQKTTGNNVLESPLRAGERMIRIQLEHDIMEISFLKKKSGSDTKVEKKNREKSYAIAFGSTALTVFHFKLNLPPC